MLKTVSYRRPSAASVLLFAVISVFILSGCSDPVRPDNPEPVIELLPAAEITRTEALISARVDRRGPGKLSYIAFHYGETGNDAFQASDCDPEASVLTLRLQGLKPGTSYSCYVEGGTTTATIRSQIISFTTQPNDLPSMSAAEPLSTGPVGIIVGFDIIDDGGEPILESGCDVTDVSAMETTRVYLPSDCLTEGYHKLHIVGLSLNTSYVITPFASNSVGEAKGASLEYTTGNSVVLTEPGSLSAIFGGSAEVGLELLTISGYMNGDDFRYLRMLLGAPADGGEASDASKVRDLDITDVYIVEGGGAFDGSRFTVNDELSTGLFADCVRLRDILLPVSATRIARDALARCTSLETLTVSASIKSVLPSEGCTSLAKIEVSPANSDFSSIDGVLFNRDITEILWFPLGKTGEYVLPGTITSIGENAFYGTSITGLEIPSSVISISRGAFAGSSLTEISFPDNITNISEGMFQGCAALTVVRLGKGTEYIGNYAFDGTSLKDLYVAAEIPPFAAEKAFVNSSSYITESCTLHVPAGCETVYRRHSKWGSFADIGEF